MAEFMRLTRCVYLIGLLFLPWAAFAQVQDGQSGAQGHETPAMQHPLTVLTEKGGLMHLDVEVTDASGKPVAGLQAKDFTLLDNGKPSTVISFQGFDGVSSQPDPPSEVIVVLDTIDLPDRLASYEKREVDRFLRENDGRLAQPVSLFWLSDTGLWRIGQPSLNGIALADAMAADKKLAMNRRTLRSQRGLPLNALTFEDPPGLAASKALGDIASNERTKRGRKLLLWVGPGAGKGSGKPYFSNLSQEQMFGLIGWFSILLRESRMVLYSFSVGESDSYSQSMDAHITPSPELYEIYVKGVRSSREARVEDLSRKVLAVESGGRVMAPTDDLATDIQHTGLSDRKPGFDLAGQMKSCVAEASVFYTLRFNPARTEQPDEYHDLSVEVDRPGLTARTSTGYYDQPYFYDQTHSASRQVTVSELEQVLAPEHGDRDGNEARKIAELKSSERISDAELASLKPRCGGRRQMRC